MKKIFLLLAAVGMIFTACTPGGGLDENGNENPGGGDIPADAYIGLNKDAVTISPDGGSVDVTVYSNYKWTLSTSCDWCTASMSGGEANEDGVVVTLSADVAYDDRETTFLFSCGNAKKVLIVSQKFKETIIADENNTFSVPAEGGVVEIAYQTTVECEIVIPQNAQSWISITPETRALVSEKATLTVAENTTYSDREVVVKVVKVGDNTLFAEYTINQVKNDAIIADENNTFNLNGCAQSINIAYQTNVECEVVIPEEAKSWISLAPATRALVNESATLNIADNNTGAERSVVVKVVAANNSELFAEYTITQAQRYYIEYTSTDGYTITPYSSDAFGVTIVRNEYIDGKGYIDFDAPITSIGDKAFWYCRSLTSVTIPDSVTEIGYQAFCDCTSLTSVTIPDSVTSIGSGAFRDCTSLTSITIPDSVTSIGNYAFSGCYSLTSVTIPDSVTSIGGSAFRDCTSLTSVTIGNGVTEIGDYAFDGCTSLTSVTIGNGVTSIGEKAFYNCSSLTSIIIPDSVTSIGGSAFEGCTSLTSITIPDSITSIGKYAFYDCTSLTSAYITDIAAWCNISFGSDSSNPLCHAENLYLNNELVTDLIIPDSVTSIGDRAFYSCDSLTSVTIPDSVTSIGYEAFWYCRSLTSVTIPDSVTSIGGDAFRDCTSLTSVAIGNGVTSIGGYAFRDCTSLTSVTIGNGVTEIGEQAFYNCKSLKEVYCKPTTPPAGGLDMFYKNASGRKIYVPRNSVEAYKAARGWSYYVPVIEGYDF